MATAAPAVPVTEKAFTGQVLDLTKLLGWTRTHFRPAQTAHGWRTAVQGDGVGFPDLVIVRPPRFILAELKTETGRLSEHQERWLHLLGQCPGIEVYMWRPSMLDEIVRTLR